MTQPTETSRALAKTIHDLAKNLLSLSEVILKQGSVATGNSSSSGAHAADSEEEDDKKSKKKKKEERDPNAPKRNLSSYMLYSQSVRPDTVKEHPELKAVDVAKLIGQKWNALSEKEKAPFVKQAEKEKERFDRETERYKNTLTGGEASSSSSSSKRKSSSNESEHKKKSKKESSEVKKESEPKKKSKKKN